MNVIEYLALHDEMCRRARALTEAKGHDYSGADDTLANLKVCEKLGICPAEKGVLVRLSDKFKRLARLVGDGAEPRVTDESVDDTILDGLNYLILLAALRKERRDESGTGSGGDDSVGAVS